MDVFADLKCHARNRNGNHWIIEGEDMLVFKESRKSDLVVVD
jgi:hypothetical protein